MSNTWSASIVAAQANVRVENTCIDREAALEGTFCDSFCDSYPWFPTNQGYFFVRRTPSVLPGSPDFREGRSATAIFPRPSLLLSIVIPTLLFPTAHRAPMELT